MGTAVAVLNLWFSAPTCAISPTQMQSVTVYSGPCVMAPISSDAPLYHVIGRVLNDLTGLPVWGATVSLNGVCGMAGTNGRNEEDHLRLQIVTDQDGEFIFDNIPAMAINLSASHSDYLQVFTFRRTANDPIGTYVIGPNTGTITLRIAPAASIWGVVRDEQGRPMPDAWITLRRFRTWSGWRGLEYFNTVKTETDGSYRFGPLQPGHYYLVAQPWLQAENPPARDADGNARGYVSVRSPPLLASDGQDTFLELAEGQQAQADFQFHRELLHHITGAISGAGQGAPIVDVLDRSGAKSYFLKSSFVGRAHACCEFESWLPSGIFRLAADYENGEGHFTGSAPFAVADTDLSGVALSLTREGRVKIPIEIKSVARNLPGVVCEDSDAGCGFWYLQLLALGPNGYLQAGPQSTMSGGRQRKGEYRNEDVIVGPGAYAIAVATMGNVYAQTITSGGVNLISEALVVAPGDIPDPIRIVLAEAAMVEGTTRRGGKQVRAWVYAVPEQPDAQLFQPILSTPNGEFRLQGLAPLPYLFFATDVELNLDIHDAKVLDYWRQRAQARTLRPGKTTSLELQVISSQ
jgi:hypothetical protein